MRHGMSFRYCIEIRCIRVIRVAAYVNKCRRISHHKWKRNAEEPHGQEGPGGNILAKFVA
jgi:hypothetical protein